MQPELTLSYTDPNGEPRQAMVRSPRFTIGRSPDNDLHIADSNLSRRHALVEFSDSVAYLSDSGSQNGTTVNGRPVSAPVVLRDGDVITLGNSCEVRVALRSAGSFAARHDGDDEWASLPPPTSNANASPGVSSAQPALAPSPGAAAQTTTPPAHSALPSWLTPPLIIALVSGVVIIFAGLLLYVLTRGGGGGSTRRGEVNAASRRERLRGNRRTRETLNSSETSPDAGSSSVDGTGDAINAATETNSAAAPVGSTPFEPAGTASAPPVQTADVSTEQTSRAVKSVMSRISTDDAPYISEAGLRDVTERIRAYRGSTALQERLRAMQRGCREIDSQAQSINLKPTLVMYAALAESEQGGADPVATARQMMPKLLTLRATFGTATANSSLLLVAAYPYPFDPPIGSQARTPHPLYTQLVKAGGQKSTVDTSVARTVWFLREKNSISPEAYNLVVRLLAIGVIAQNPRQHGIDADPVLC